MNETSAFMRTESKMFPVLQSARLTGHVTDLVAYLLVEHRYRNVSDEEIEINYTFPTPPEAVLTSVTLDLNGKILKGLIKPKKAAEATYETAIEDGNSAVLVERAGPGLYSSTLGNLLPSEEATISYEWILPVRVQQGRAQISIPTTIKNRFGNPQIDGHLKAHQTTEQNSLVEYPFTVEIDFDAHSSKARISAPEHETAEIETSESTNATCKKLLINDDAFLDRNLYIVFDELPALVKTTRIETPEDIFLHATFPTPESCKTNPVSVKILIDCSGSMQDEDAIDQAKKAAKTLVKNLRKGDYASVSSFGSKAFHPFPRMLELNKTSAAKLSEEIGFLSANLGGTQLETALIETLRKVETPEQAPPCSILLITDGASWAHRRIIRAAINAGHRIFCIGVGDNPAESLLFELGTYTRGGYTMLAQGASLELAVSGMLSRMREAGAIKATVSWGEPSTTWLSSTPPASVYSLEQLHIFGRTPKHLLEGTESVDKLFLTYSNNDEEINSQHHQVIVAEDPRIQGLTKLAAAVELMSATEAQAIDLALRYQLVSEHTSLVIVHERELDNKAVGLPEPVQIKQMTSIRAPRSSGRIARSMSIPSYRTGDEVSALNSVHESPAIWRQPRSDNADSSMESLDSLDIPAFLRKSTDDEGLAKKTSSSDTLNSSPLSRKPTSFGLFKQLMLALMQRTSLDKVKTYERAMKSNEALEGVLKLYAQKTSPEVTSPYKVLEEFNTIAQTKTSFEDALSQLVSKVILPNELLAGILRVSNVPAAAPLAALLLLMSQKIGRANSPLSLETLEFLRNGLEQVTTTSQRQRLTEVIEAKLNPLNAELWPDLASDLA